MVFLGATRYRVPWDFVVALLAAATLVALAGRYGRGEDTRRLAAGERPHQPAA